MAKKWHHGTHKRQGCMNCGDKAERVTITDGLNPDGSPIVKFYCGNKCAAAGGYPWAGLPSRFQAEHAQQPEAQPAGRTPIPSTHWMGRRKRSLHRTARRQMQ